MTRLLPPGRRCDDELAEDTAILLHPTRARSNRKASPCKLSQGRAQRSGRRFKADISCLAMDLEARNGTGGNDDEEYTNIYFIVGDRRETVTYKADQVTDMELKELFRNAAEAGPLDIVKLCKGDKLLNISTNLPANTPDSPYVLQVSTNSCQSRCTRIPVAGCSIVGRATA